MRVLLITDRSAIPPALRDVLERGSTSLEERSAADDGAAPADQADRVVFWAGADVAAVMQAARAYLGEPPDRRGDRIVFVTTEGAGTTLSGLAPNELFVWPRDEDRLRMAFMTGA